MTEKIEAARSGVRRERWLRLLETVSVWLLVAGLFMALAYGVVRMVGHGIERADEILAQSGTSISVAHLANTVVAPGLGEPEPDGDGSDAPLILVERVVPPRWERMPNPRYPMTDGRRVDGSVELRCLVSDRGVPKDCVILNETPAGVGFGDAALEAAGRARLKPRMSGGVPTAGTIQFSIRFSPDSGRGAQVDP